MTTIGLSGALIATLIIRHHAFAAGPQSKALGERRLRVARLTTAVFTACFAVCWRVPDAGLYGLLLLVPLRGDGPRTAPANPGRVATALR